MKIDVLTLFPEMFVPVKTSMLGKAEEKGILEIRLTDTTRPTTIPSAEAAAWS